MYALLTVCSRNFARAAHLLAQILIGIANSMDFNVSFSTLRKPPQKVLFAAYTSRELVNILTERVGGIIHSAAISLCAKKVAASYGDARRALSLCREAVNVARREWQAEEVAMAGTQGQQRIEHGAPHKGHGGPIVTIAHMLKAVGETRASRYEDAIAGLSLQAQIVLCVAASLGARAEVDDGSQTSTTVVQGGARLTQGRLHEKCIAVWSKTRAGGGLSQVEFSGTIDILAAQGLLRIRTKKNVSSRARHIALLVDFSDVQAALGDKPFFDIVTSA